jgi:hypothetical protein
MVRKFKRINTQNNSSDFGIFIEKRKNYLWSPWCSMDLLRTPTFEKMFKGMLGYKLFTGKEIRGLLKG